MQRHPILYPVVAAPDCLEVKVSDLRTLPYREHESESAAGRSKYVCPMPTGCSCPGILRHDPTGLGSGCLWTDKEAQPPCPVGWPFIIRRYVPPRPSAGG